MDRYVDPNKSPSLFRNKKCFIGFQHPNGLWKYPTPLSGETRRRRKRRRNEKENYRRDRKKGEGGHYVHVRTRKKIWESVDKSFSTGKSVLGGYGFGSLTNPPPPQSSPGYLSGERLAGESEVRGRL